MLIALHVLTALIAIITVLPLSRHKAWWIRGWDFPRAQIALLAAASLAGYAFNVDELDRWHRVAPVVAITVLAYQLWWIIPYTRLHRREVADAPANGTRVRLLSANVLQTNRQTDRLKEFIAELDPDIFLALETDSWWRDQLKSVEQNLPHTLACPLGNLYGMLLYSRWPIEDGRTQFLVEPDKPSIHTAVRLPDGRQLRLVCLHPAPPSPTENEESTERDAELILVARSLAKEERPSIVVGDLNDVAWSRTTRLFRKVSGMLDPRVGRGLFNTFHARWFFMRWPVDHLFHTRHFTLARLRRLGAFGSDHFPVFAELVLAAGNQNGEPLPERPEDRETAREETRPSGKSPAAVHVPGRKTSR